MALTGYVLSNRVYHPKPSMSVLKVLLSVRPGQVEEQEGEAGEGGATPKGNLSRLVIWWCRSASRTRHLLPSRAKQMRRQRGTRKWQSPSS